MQGLSNDEDIPIIRFIYQSTKKANRSLSGVLFAFYGRISFVSILRVRVVWRLRGLGMALIALIASISPGVSLDFFSCGSWA